MNSLPEQGLPSTLLCFNKQLNEALHFYLADYTIFILSIISFMEILEERVRLDQRIRLMS
jgi:hypothetical protein